MVNNSLGTDSHELVVLKPGKPEAPGNIDLVATTDHSVTLSWRPGFDGGYNQSFVVSVLNKWQCVSWLRRHLCIIKTADKCRKKFDFHDAS